MKTCKALAALVLAAFSLSIAAAAFAQSGTSGTVQVTPAKPAPKKGAVTTTIKPIAVSPKPAGAATATAKTTTATGEKKAAKGEKKSETPGCVVGARSIVGEVVDPGCWIVNGVKGPSHKDCAIACAKAGQVLGILESKTQKLYILATDKPGEDPNKGLIDYVGQMVTAKGRVYSRGGATGIKITSVAPYSPMAAQ
jgi:hypothetical protein